LCFTRSKIKKVEAKTKEEKNSKTEKQEQKHECVGSVNCARADRATSGALPVSLNAKENAVFRYIEPFSTSFD